MLISYNRTYLETSLVSSRVLVYSCYEDAKRVFDTSSDHKTQGLRTHHLHLNLPGKRHVSSASG
ncbi:hypothetical protein E2C01_037418 [Portunus trituberculatus]|uniref:Uncharacterized protein n=1 Tax=Portunus trituberculatus TaxID=210409 RepID=A0A5B7FEK0_PORTR|nr:hypothetical protein [Portunus trituberculatus]